MIRGAARALIAVALLGTLWGCTKAPTPGLTRTPAPTPVTGPTSTPAPAASPTPDPAARLPRVLAEIRLGEPQGDAYAPSAVAFDEAGRTVVLCYGQGRPTSAVSGLVALDLACGTRGPAMALPGQSIGPLAAANGRAYVGYQDKEYHQHLLSIDLQTGRTLADVRADKSYYGDALAADPGGALYSLTADQLEVRDAGTLEVTRSVAYASGPGERALVLDAAHGRLYLAAGERLLAYRTSDLQLLWEAASTVGAIRSLTVDRAGGRVYARGERYEEGSPAARLQAFSADGGQALEPPAPPEGTGWQLVLADGEAGRLIFAEAGQGTRLWQTSLDGRPTGTMASLGGYAPNIRVDPDGRLVALLPDSHLVVALDPADLRVVARVPTGVEIRNLVPDATRGRLYVNDASGRLYAIDSRTNRLETSLPAGSGALVLDAPNSLLFVTREPWSREVAVVDTDALTVTALITGGDRVAIDSRGHRAFLGWAGWGPSTPAGEVAVYDTRTFQRTGAIPHRGAPTYNPVRDEIYLRDYSAYVADGKTLALTGELTPDIGGQEVKWCNGCRAVGNITVDPQQDVIVVGMVELSAGKGPGTMPQPRLFAAGTRQPVTHTVTVLSDWDRGEPPILPPDDGRVYEGQRYSRYIGLNGAVVYAPGSAQELDYRDGLKLDYYLPGAHTVLSLLWSYIQVYDARTWEPLGRIPYQPIHALDLAARRLYAWEGSLLTVLSFDGSHPLAPEPAEPWPAGRPFEAVQQAQLSPAFERDRTLFVVAGKRILRSTDAGATWTQLKGGLPTVPEWGLVGYRLAVSPAYAEDHTLFVGGSLGDPVGLGIWRSTDGGASWQPSWQGLAHLKVGDVVISPRYAQDHTLLAYCRYDRFWRGESGSSLFRSADGGASWTLVASLANAGSDQLPRPEELLTYPAQQVQFRAAPASNELLRSADFGRTWQPVLRRGEAYVPLMAVLCSPGFDADQQVFALYSDLLYRSSDGGLTWQAATDRDLVRSDYRQYFTAMALGAGPGGGLALFLGDGAGRVLPVDPAHLHWGAPPPATPTPEPTPCGSADPPFQSLFASRWHAALGCPGHPVAEAASASQQFEHGRMFWRADWRMIYVLFNDSQGTHWAGYADTWQEGQPDHDPALQPPEGRQQPVRGFGKLWREQLGGAQSPLGWAMEGEQSYSGRWQDFEQGMVLIAPEGRTYALFADGRYESE